MANQYNINYGEILRDAEAIKNSRYGRNRSKRQDARQVKKDARQDVLNQRQDEEFAYGKQKRSKQDARQDILNQRADSAYENSQEQQQYQQGKAQLTEFGSMINYIEKAPIMMRQKAWDDVRGSLSPSGQENTPQQYDQDWLNLTKARVQKQAQDLTANEQLARDKFDEAKKQSVIKNKASERDFAYGKEQDTIKQKAANKESLEGGGFELKSGDESNVSRSVAQALGGFMDRDGNITGLKKGIAEDVLDISARASRIFKDAKGKITRNEASQNAVKEYQKNQKNQKEFKSTQPDGTKAKKNGKKYITRNGQWVEQ
jgi:hypothetical protein